MRTPNTAPVICFRCSSHDIVRSFDAIGEREMTKHECRSCDYVWWLDTNPPPAAPVRLVVDVWEELLKENAALRDIIANQAVVIADYQDMVRTL